MAAAITYGLHVILKRRKPKGPIDRVLAAARLCFVAAILLTLIAQAVESVLWLGSPQEQFAMFLDRSAWINTFTFYVWIYMAWAALYAVVINAADLRERDRRLATAEREAQQAQLAALRLQIHPHFLFNALNALSGLVALGRQPEAERMILNLSSFLRRTLTSDPDQLTSLQEEIEVQMMYLGIEQVRFSDRLRIDCSLPEDCKQALVPKLILQPLVENAIKHGLAPTDGIVTVSVGATRRGNVLEVWIKDDGAMNHDSVPGFGIGLRNVRDRLKALFGDEASLNAGREGAGWVSRILIPWMKTETCVS